MDGWDFKYYLLGTMFYRYISENLTSYINSGEAEAGNTDFDYAEMSDEDAAENEYNLSVSTYVEAEDTRERIDIVNLIAEIREIVAREQVLRDEINMIIAEIEGGRTDE